MIKGHEQWNDRNDNKTKQSCNDRVNKTISYTLSVQHTCSTSPPETPQAFELLKIGSFKFPPPWAKIIIAFKQEKMRWSLGSNEQFLI